MSQPWEPPGQPPATEPSSAPQAPGGPGVPGDGGPSPTAPFASPTQPGGPAGPYPGPPTGFGAPPPAPSYPSYPAYPSYPPYAGYQPYAAAAVRAPGGVPITAAVIQLVQCAFWLFVGVVLVVVSRNAIDLFDSQEVSQEDLDNARGALVAFGIFVILVAAGMATLAILVLRRVNGCRIASAITQIVFGVFPLVALAGSLSDGDVGGTLFSLLLLAAAATAATLLFLPASARYCQRPVPGHPGVPGPSGY